MKPSSVSLQLVLAKVFVAGALLLAVVLLGGRPHFSVAIIQIFILAAFFLWELDFFKVPVSGVSLYRPLSHYLFSFAVFLFLCAVQYSGGAGILSYPHLGSVYPYQTYELLIQSVSYLLLCIVCVRMSVHRRLVDNAAVFLVWIVFAVSLLGMIQKLSGSQNPIFWQRYFEGDRNFGPFINENDFGGFLALAFPWMLALLHYRCVCVQRILYQRFKQTGTKASLWEAFATGLEQGIVFILLLIFLSVGACLVATARSALFVISVSTFVYFIFQGWNQKKIRFLAGFIFLAGLIAAAVFYFADKAILDQYQFINLNKDLHNRIEIASQSLRLFEKFPWFGTGLGTYAFISNWVVHFTGSTFRFVHADNDYVELLTDTGLVGFVLFMFSIGGLVLRCVFKKNESRSLWKRLMHYQAGIAIFSVAILEIPSFCLRTPAIALLFVFQLAVLYGTSLPSQDNLAQEEKQRDWAWSRRALGVLFLIGVIFLLVFPVRSLVAYGYSQKGDRLSGLEKAVQWQPSKAEYWFQIAVESEKLSRQINEPNLIHKAVRAMDKAVELAPSYGHYWFVRGVFQYDSGMRKEGIDSLKKAVFWAPNFFRYHFYLLRIYLRESVLARASSEKKRWSLEAKELYRQILNLPVPPQDWQARQLMGNKMHGVLKKYVSYWGAQQVG